MNIFPTNIQCFITKKHFENKKEIILLYTDPNYINENLLEYYYPEKMHEKIKLTVHLFKNVAWYGNIRLMIFLFEKGCLWNSWTFRNAAGHGNLDNMKWLLENGCPWNTDTFDFAVLHGNLENMKWLKANGCPWDYDTFKRAEYHGNLENIQWLKENGCPHIFLI